MTHVAPVSGRQEVFIPTDLGLDTVTPSAPQGYGAAAEDVFTETTLSLEYVTSFVEPLLDVFSHC